MDTPTTLFFVVFAGFVGYFIYRMLRYGGLRGAMFGAKVERTVGEVPARKQGLLSTVIKVHLLNRDTPEILVGLEFVAKSITSYEMTGFALSAVDAQKLALLLQEAARGR